MRFLITGAQGFLGRYLTGLVLESDQDAQVVGIGRSPRMDGYFTHTVTLQGRAVQARVPERLLNVPYSRWAYEQVCLSDAAGLRSLARRFGPDVVVHLASGLLGDDWQTLVQTNVAGTASLITALGETCRRPPVVVLGSTGGVYGRVAPEDLPVTEQAPCNPVDVYAATKLSSEQIGRVLCAEYGMRCVAARLFNLSGPGQSERHVCGRFASAVAEAAESPVPDLRTGDLSTTRDYIDVRDAAAALLLLSELGEGTYNIASGIETPTSTVLEILSRYAGIQEQLSVKQRDDLNAGVPRHVGCVDRLVALGYRPAFPLHRSLMDILNYYVEPRKPEATRVRSNVAEAKPTA